MNATLIMPKGEDMKNESSVPKVQAAEVTPIIYSGEEMIECQMSPGEKVEKGIAFESLRNDQCRERGLQCCVD